MYANYVIKTVRNKPAKSKEPTTVWPAGTVWAAAAYAHRINGEYLKYSTTTEAGETKPDSRTLMDRALRDTSLIKETDIALGQAAREYHTRNLLFRALKKPLTEFESVLSRACALDGVSERDRYSLAVICSQIAGYLRGIEQDTVFELVNPNAAPVGAVGSKVSTKITVIRSNYSIKYGVYFVNAVTDLGQPLFFSFKQNLGTGSKHAITGTIKAMRPDATQLNRVKIFKD